MKIDIEQSKPYFKRRLSKKYLTFIEERNVTAKGYLELLKSHQYGFMVENSIKIGKDEYSVQYILGPSEEDIYDLIRDNEIYGIKPEEGTIFAVLLGDDYLFFKPNDDAVYFCFRDTEEIIKVAESLKDFEKNIITGEIE